MAEKHTDKDEAAQTDAAGQTPAADEHAYFFPNSGDGTPFSCQAKSLEAAEKLNDQYLNNQKENHS